MATAVQLYRDSRGLLHETAEAADAADAAFERDDRREAVHRMLVAEIQSTWSAGRQPASDTSSARLADWLINRWPTLRAIGFAYRVHELGHAGEAAIPSLQEG